MSVKECYLPVIDGHFWIECADGSVVDPDFHDYNFIAKVNNTTTERVYKAAPSIVQQAILKKYMIALFDTAINEEVSDKLKQHMIKQYSSPKSHCCIQNVIVYSWLHKDCKIVFGSMGFVRRNKTVHWEFGGDDWSTVTQFIKKDCYTCVYL